MEVKGNAIKFSIMWEAEKKALKKVDWSVSEIFSHFLNKHIQLLNQNTGPSKLQNLSLSKQLEQHPTLASVAYTDVELEYIISLIRKTQNSDGFTSEDRKAFIMRYFNKTLKTLKALFDLL